jgi:hypothetical protein
MVDKVESGGTGTPIRQHIIIFSGFKLEERGSSVTGHFSGYRIRKVVNYTYS